MAQTMTRAEVEYRFNYDVARSTCPLCGSEFEPRLGSWPFVAGTTQAVCGGAECPIGDDVTGPSPCDTYFEFIDLSDEALSAIEADGHEGESVAEKLRRVALDEALPDPDRAVLQIASIDLLFCEADGTRIRQLRPKLSIQTCAEAAAELLLSGCGEIVEQV